MEEQKTSSLGVLLRENTWAKIGEILVLFLVALLPILLVGPLVEDDPILTQVVVWIANVLMLLVVWLGIKLRGDTWASFGLHMHRKGAKEHWKTFGLSLLVFVLAMLGFALGAIIMANVTGIPEGSDMSGYDYLRGNIGMLLLSLLGVLFVSSFGEEVIYRGFLINRFSELMGNERWGRTLAVVLSSVIFGLVHYKWGPMGVVQTTFMGLALAICYLKLNKRLWILILAHAYMDTILLVQMYMKLG